MTTFIESQKANTGGVAYEVILKPAAGDGPRPSSPPKDKNITHNDIVKKLQEAEERRQVRIRTSPMTGGGNTMPDLSDLVPFHSGQIRNFYLLVLGQVKMNLQFCIPYLVINMNSHVV